VRKTREIVEETKKPMKDTDNKDVLASMRTDESTGTEVEWWGRGSVFNGASFNGAFILGR
jgi:hypothetical protein